MNDLKGIPSKDKAFDGSDEEFLGKLNSWFEAAKKNRQVMDWNWYIYENYYKGNHYIQFNKKTNQIVTPPRPKGQIRLTINKIYSYCRAIRNFVTSYRPRWEVASNSTAEEVVNSSKKSAETLDYYYDYLKMPRLIRGVSLYTIKFGIGFWQYGWDEEAEGLDNQTGEVAVWVRDPFDVYMDKAGMETGDLQNCRYIDIAVSKPVQEILDNPVYSKKLEADDVSGTTVRAASEMKQILIRDQYPDTFSSEDELKDVILHETLYKKKVKGETEVWVASWIEGHLLRNEKTEFSKYPLIPIPSDDNANEIYGEGYIKNLIPIAKARNRLESQIVEYNNLVNRGRIIADKGAGVSKITNETGEIIEKNVGSTITEMRPAGLAPDIHTQINRLNNYDEDISGVKEAFMGGVPTGVKSGVALESLKAQTANNLQDVKDNVEYALAQLGEAILELLANKLVVPRQLRTTNRSGEQDSFKIVGQVGVEPNQEISDDTYVIGNQNRVKVIIGSDLAYTREGRVTRLDKLLETKVIDPTTYLEELEFGGDIATIAERAKKARFEEAMLNQSGGPMAGMPGQAPQDGAQGGQGGNPPQGAPQGQGEPMPQEQSADSWTKLADDENQTMIKTLTLPPDIIDGTPNAPKEHTAVHIAWSQSDEVQQSEQLLRLLSHHIEGEEKMQGAPPMSAPQKGQNAS